MVTLIAAERWVGTVLWSAIAGLTFVAQILLESRLQSDQLGLSDRLSSETATHWDPELTRAMSFGQVPAVVDAIWIRAMMDASIKRLGREIRPRVFGDLELAVELDPAFYDVYYGGAMMLSVIRDDVEGAKALLLRAKAFRDEVLPTWPEANRKEHWGQEWQLSVLLGYIELYELDHLPRAAEAFAEASRFPDAPQYVKSMTSRLSKPGGVYEVGLRLLNFLISGATDETTKEKLEKKRASLYLSQFLFHLNEDFFRSQAKPPAQDPWGGRIFFNAQGKIDSTTPRVKVFGLE